MFFIDKKHNLLYYFSMDSEKMMENEDIFATSDEIIRQREIFDKFSSNSNKLFNDLKDKYNNHSSSKHYDLCVLQGSRYNRKVEVFFGKKYNNPMQQLSEENQNEIKNAIPLDFILQYSFDDDTGYSTVIINFTKKHRITYMRDFIIINQTNKIENLLKINKIVKHYKYLITFISRIRKPTLYNRVIFKLFMITKRYKYNNITHDSKVKKYFKIIIMGVISFLLGIFTGIFGELILSG